MEKKKKRERERERIGLLLKAPLVGNPGATPVLLPLVFYGGPPSTVVTRLSTAPCRKPVLIGTTSSCESGSRPLASQAGLRSQSLSLEDRGASWGSGL